MKRCAVTKSILFCTFLGTLFVVGLAVEPAQAQATRTWVSGVGDDANPCSRTAPCKTWPGAIAKTATGGEIDALDPGGFGTVTITKSITLDGGGGQVASILAAPGLNGVNVSAASGIVILRNLRLNGAGGTTGVAINSAAKVIIEKCDIFGFTVGAAIQVSVSSGTLQLKVQETTLNNNAGGITSKPSGGATVNASIERTHADANTGGGVRVDGTGGGSSNVAISDSSISLNGGNGLNAVSGPSGNVKVDLTRVVVANNTGNALQSSNSTGGTSTVTVGQSMLSNNGAAWAIVSTGQLLSYGNNQVTGPVGTGPTAGGIQPQ
ncbi:MAG TPA: right-handed parallel beta-helix repeat-containing protein [Xanthobacteraceae bacterium]|nr:right-handed parallel beta-helix repeat-containing protein [Xanthobacteraceae bacterium]